MKKTLLFLIALITATIAFAKTEINGIYYNLIDETKTAEVTYQYQYRDGDNYSDVTSITIPEKVTYNSTEYSVTSIGYAAFYECTSLTSITIPNNVTSIGEYAFYDCDALTSISIPNRVTSIGNVAFYGTPWLNNQPDGCLYIGKCLYQYKGEMPENTHIDVKEGTTMICGAAFYECSSLTSITIPNSVTSIGDHAFYNCSSLTSITIEATTPPTLNDWLGYSGIIYIPDNTLSAYKEAWGTDYIFVNNETTLTIHIETPGTLSDKIFDAGQSPINVTKLTVTGTLNDDDFTCMRETMTSLVDVNLSAITNTTGINFNDKSNLIKILLPENLTYIGNSAFENCLSLTSITIPNSVTEIGDCAFWICSSLTSITIPNSVTSIGYDAFWGCSSLTSITIPNSVTSIEYGTFSECSSLTSITCLGSTPPSANNLRAQYETCILFVPKGSLYDYQNHAEWGKFLNIQELEGEKYTITTAVNDESMGSVTGEGEYKKDSEITLTATANSGYRFAQWSDGNTDNPRTIIVTQDSTFTAIFELEEYALYATSASPELGYVKHTIEAIAIEGFEFDRWSDGNTENPRTIVLTKDTKLYAYFRMAQGGNPVDLENSKISSANIYTTNGILHIEGATENYHILDAAGRLIYSGNASTLQLPRGIYLITMGGEVEKIVL